MRRMWGSIMNGGCVEGVLTHEGCLHGQKIVISDKFIYSMTYSKQKVYWITNNS